MKLKYIILAVVVGLLVVGWYKAQDISRFSNYQIEKNKLPETYRELAKQCYEGSKDQYQCCMASVKGMAADNTKVMPSTGCPDGSVASQLLCQGSFRSCRAAE